MDTKKPNVNKSIGVIETSAAVDSHLYDDPEVGFCSNELEVYPTPNKPKIPRNEYPDEENSLLVDSPAHDVLIGTCNLKVAADATLPKRKQVIKTKIKERIIELLNEC